ncbi:alpha/beta fold hydrolase [Sneathiella sp. HT1-7]|uniref:alpha/beta fold hydrolase n=1 Tax=Sneathiella sp. HT1-7 TaxID=2887192 RepID=UPI001D158062|nr:alpha/beta hydrolase [Sneathiella sp. HT1-7]MCC3305942.1 alpha/beta hydrolase [Sneathiella sp. HT1-7]
MTAISHKRVKIGDINLHYAECGSGNEELILMLHGFPEFWYCWKDQLPALGERYHAVAPDMRGYNLSDKPEGVKAYRIHHLIGDMVGLADHLGQEKFYLVAHDWGVAVAYAIAIAYPERIKGLIVMNGPHPYIFAELLNNNDEQIKHSQYMAYFQTPGVEEEMLKDNGKWLMDWTFKHLIESGQMSSEDEMAYRTAWAQPGAMTAMLNYYRASPLVPATSATKGRGSGMDPEKFKVHVPTLILWGDADHALIKSNITGIEKFIDDVTVKMLPGVTHWVTHEAPETVTEEILSFIGGLE